MAGYQSKEDWIRQNVPQRGKGPWFVHSGRVDSLTDIQGATFDNWAEALLELCQLTDYGNPRHTSDQQIITGAPSRGLITVAFLESLSSDQMVVDMMRPKDVELIRSLDNIPDVY